ncbi:hypothetical protein [Halobacillus sp. KGW1]|uniref:hypothetical protein n=1 Tax=Halobacillus sp. KGW1 TaxID=1793726 RepID=UPI000784D273|nr:hypothetical protein [Halobacillus sp. KGW1]
MEGFKKPKETNLLSIININQVGLRTCKVCKNEVPIYERAGQRISVCMKCDHRKLSIEKSKGYVPPKRRELVNRVQQIQQIPNELLDVTLSDYIPKTKSQKEALDVITHYSKAGDTNFSSIVFKGKPGTGKSHLFRCAVRNLEEQKFVYEEDGNMYQVPHTVLFLKVPKLMKVIQSTYSNGSGLREQQILTTIFHVDYLILDEIG